MILGAVYEIITAKSEPLLYFFLVAIPGSIFALLKELKEILPPEKLYLEIKNDNSVITTFQQQIPYSETFRWITVIKIPVRIWNRDPNKSIDILDVKVESNDEGVELLIPKMREVPINGVKKWMFSLVDTAVEELFNTGKKTIKPMKEEDYFIGLHDCSKGRDVYQIRISFADNYGRIYTFKVKVTRKK